MEERSLTKEQSNYIRLMTLVLRAGREVVQIKFDYEFHPTQFAKELQRNKFKLHKLRGKVFQENQWQLMYPSSGVPLSSTFDISLMISLLRNLTTDYNSIQDSLPTFPTSRYVLICQESSIIGTC